MTEELGSAVITLGKEYNRESLFSTKGIVILYRLKLCTSWRNHRTQEEPAWSSLPHCPGKQRKEVVYLNRNMMSYYPSVSPLGRYLMLRMFCIKWSNAGTQNIVHHRMALACSCSSYIPIECDSAMASRYTSPEDSWTSVSALKIDDWIFFRLIILRNKNRNIMYKSWVRGPIVSQWTLSSSSYAVYQS